MLFVTFTPGYSFQGSARDSAKQMNHDFIQYAREQIKKALRYSLRRKYWWHKLGITGADFKKYRASGPAITTKTYCIRQPTDSGSQTKDKLETRRTSLLDWKLVVVHMILKKIDDIFIFSFI